MPDRSVGLFRYFTCAAGHWRTRADPPAAQRRLERIIAVAAVDADGRRTGTHIYYMGKFWLHQDAGHGAGERC